MDINSFLTTLVATDNPLLPSPTAMRVALHGVWALVLGCGVLLGTGKLSRPYRLGSSLLVMAWTLMPGSASPAYWLGLAFQTPSLMSAVICLAWFLDRARRKDSGGVRVAVPHVPALKILVTAGIGLGWVQLLDTLAWFPVPVYTWGFSSAAFGAVAVLVTLLWVFFGAAGANRKAPGWGGLALPLAVLTLFVLTRLPTGNVWDALIDPWLWVALQVGWLISAARRLTLSRLVRYQPLVPEQPGLGIPEVA